jgi:hypothetical protein
MNPIMTLICVFLIAISIVGTFWCMMQAISIALNHYIRNKRRKEQQRNRERMLKEQAAEKIIDIRTKQLYKKDGTQ